MNKLTNLLLGYDGSGFTKVKSVEAAGLSSSEHTAAEAREVAEANLARVLKARKPAEPDEE